MILEVVKECSFDAAHFLPGYDGKCNKIHGHSWRVQVGFKGQINPETGMVIDFVEVKRIMEHYIINILDHSFLNALESRLTNDPVPKAVLSNFPNNLPTAENMVEWIVWILQTVLKGELEQKLSFVRLYESSTSYVEWRKD